MRDHHHRTGNTFEEPVDAFCEHLVAFGSVTRRAELPFARITVFGNAGIVGFDLGKGPAFPVTEAEFDQEIVRSVGFRIEAGILAHQLHRLAGARQRAGNPCMGFRMEAGKGREASAIAGGLAASEFVERDVPRALKATLAIIVSLPVADDVERQVFHDPGSCLSERVGAGRVGNVSP